MVLYVLRHAEAVERSDGLKDEWRYLTAKGRASAKTVSSSIAKYGPKPRGIITSPLTRAVQTAEIVAAKACRKHEVSASQLLLPDAGIGDLVAFLEGVEGGGRVMLVGHQPQLGELVATLLGRKNDVFSLKKGACVALKFNPGGKGNKAEFLWYLVPGAKPKRDINKLVTQ